VKRIQALHVAVFMMSEDEQKVNKEETQYRSLNITDATEKDWEDFFAVQEENIFDR
jgi:uncharacterized cysteine cluster protein YcgN (CxxCxxCC family)